MLVHEPKWGFCFVLAAPRASFGIYRGFSDSFSNNLMNKGLEKSRRLYRHKEALGLVVSSTLSLQL